MALEISPSRLVITIKLRLNIKVKEQKSQKINSVIQEK